MFGWMSLHMMGHPRRAQLHTVGLAPPSSSSLTSPARPVLLDCFRWEEERNGRGKAATACMQAEESGRRREEEEEEGGRRRGR